MRLYIVVIQSGIRLSNKDRRSPRNRTAAGGPWRCTSVPYLWTTSTSSSKPTDFFFLLRETSRLEWHGTEPPADNGRPSFRTLEEVGEETFVEAIEKVSEGTHDREIREERQRLGAKRAPQDFFEDAQRVMHDSPWWRLAYAPSGNS
jgi:hypothetical protein